MKRKRELKINETNREQKRKENEERRMEKKGK
jgi:hypothetical protein